MSVYLVVDEKRFWFYFRSMFHKFYNLCDTSPGKNWVPPPIEPEWTLEKSIFAPRKKNHELQTFLEFDHFEEVGTQ